VPTPIASRTEHLDEDLEEAIGIINSRRKKGLPAIKWREIKVSNPTFGLGRNGQKSRDRRWELLSACGRPCVEVRPACFI